MVSFFIFARLVFIFFFYIHVCTHTCMYTYMYKAAGAAGGGLTLPEKPRAVSLRIVVLAAAGKKFAVEGCKCGVDS